jgi:hypothetical protein
MPEADNGERGRFYRLKFWQNLSRVRYVDGLSESGKMKLLTLTDDRRGTEILFESYNKSLIINML